MDYLKTIQRFTHFRYIPPVRFLRVSETISWPLLLVPMLGIDIDESNAQEVSNKLTELMRSKLVGLDLDFYPVYAMGPVSSIDIVRDFPTHTKAVNFYMGLRSSNDPRALDVKFAADNNNKRRHYTHSNHIVSHKHLHPLCKKYYRIISVECKKLYDAEEWHYNEAGFMFAPHHISRQKLNSSLAKSISSVYRDHGYKARASDYAAFITVQKCELTEEDKAVIMSEVDSNRGHTTELYSLFN